MFQKNYSTKNTNANTTINKNLFKKISSSSNSIEFKPDSQKIIKKKVVIQDKIENSAQKPLNRQKESKVFIIIIFILRKI
jgi:hypothetical protein